MNTHTDSAVVWVVIMYAGMHHNLINPIDCFFVFLSDRSSGRERPKVLAQTSASLRLNGFVTKVASLTQALLTISSSTLVSKYLL